MKLGNRKKKDNIYISKIKDNHKWKEKNEIYLKELERFFDKADSIKDEELKNNIINQMLRCDNVLTNMAEEMFIKYYEKGQKQEKLE